MFPHLPSPLTQIQEQISRERERESLPVENSDKTLRNTWADVASTTLLLRLAFVSVLWSARCHLNVPHDGMQ